MKRSMFLEYDTRNDHTIRVDRQAQQPSPVTSGVVVGETVFELTAYSDGQVELVRRDYGRRVGQKVTIIQKPTKAGKQ